MMVTLIRSICISETGKIFILTDYKYYSLVITINAMHGYLPGKVPSEITRVAVKVTLKQAKFSQDLAKKTSEAYQSLKNTVVEAVSNSCHE